MSGFSIFLLFILIMASISIFSLLISMGKAVRKSLRKENIPTFSRILFWIMCAGFLFRPLSAMSQHGSPTVIVITIALLVLIGLSGKLLRARAQKNGTFKTIWMRTSSGSQIPFLLQIFFLGIFALTLPNTLSIALKTGDSAAIVVTLALLLIATTVMQPALWAHLAIWRGWVRAAYFLGRWARWVNRRSLRGGGLFYGWRALQWHRNDSERYQAGWTFLQSRLDNSGKKINSKKMDSGVLLMQIILHRDEMGEDHYYRRLLTAGCLTVYIQPGLARYAFRLLASHALARGDWENLMRVIPEWRKRNFIPLAIYLAHTYQRTHDGKPGSRTARIFDWLWFGRSRWTTQLPPVSGAPDSMSGVAILNGKALRQQSWALGNAVVPEALAQAWWQELDAPERLAVWQVRAQQLGCRDVDAALAGLRQSVDAWLEYTAASATGVAVAAADIDRLFDKLRYQTRAIDQRQAQHNLMSGSEEFEEFLSLMELFDQLSGDPVQQHQAYAIFEYPVWNWMAELWNTAKEKWLAYFICARLYPYAQSVDSRAARVYEQILSGEVR